ncbi:protein AMBP-like isoform X2 [Xyrichtys novacula]|nr:protein AMBP-like isoform X2 [Xyrichtys novacula]
MGRWYEAAVVSTCPHYMQRKRGNPVMVAMELQQISPEGNFTMTSSSSRNGLCMQTSTGYSSTDTPGRFFHHVARSGADVDSFVVHINYSDFALMIQLSTEKPSGTTTTMAKLFSRTQSVSPAVLHSFKSLVRQYGLSEADIVNQSKGECVPSEQVPKAITTQPQVK